MGDVVDRDAASLPTTVPTDAGPGADAEPTGRGRVLAVLTTLHTINDLYALVLPPVLPVLRALFDLTYSQIGVVPFVSTAISAVFQPTLGYAADRRQQRRLFVAGGFVLFAVSCLWLSVVDSYLMLLLAAALLGFSGATYHPQSATYLVHYFRQNRGFAQGIHGIGNGLGFLLGPALVPILIREFGWSWALRALAVPALVAAGLTLWQLREPTLQASRGLLGGITRPLLLLTLVTGLALGAGSGFTVWLPTFYTVQGYSIVAAGLLTAIMATSALIAQPLGGALSDRIGRRNLIGLSLLGVAFFQALFVVSPVGVLTVVCSLLLGFCASLLPPVTMVYASELAAGQRTGTAVGVVWGLGVAISSVTPLLVGFLVDAAGFAVAYGALVILAITAAGLTRLLPRPALTR